MLCPNCGTKTTAVHKFCRGCGMNLEPVSKALAAHLAPGGGASAAAAREAERRAARRLRNGLLAGAVVILLAVLALSVLSGKAFKLMAVVAALLGVLLSLAAVLAPLRAGARREEEDAHDPGAPDEGAKMTRRLLREEQAESHLSVTERTTELLGVETGAPKPRGE